MAVPSPWKLPSTPLGSARLLDGMDDPAGEKGAVCGCCVKSKRTRLKRTPSRTKPVREARRVLNSTRLTFKHWCPSPAFSVHSLVYQRRRGQVNAQSFVVSRTKIKTHDDPDLRRNQKQRSKPQTRCNCTTTFHFTQMTNRIIFRRFGPVFGMACYRAQPARIPSQSKCLAY